MKKIKYAIFISGTGSNLNAALEMRDHVDIGLVVSSRKKALGILKAKRAGVPVHILKVPVDWQELTHLLKSHGIERILLLGFMKILPSEFVHSWEGRIWNIHPSLLPQYPGLESIEKCFADQNPFGVTVHEVVAEMDAGPITLQRKVTSSDCLNLHQDVAATEFEIHRNEHRLVRELLSRGVTWNHEVISS